MADEEQQNNVAVITGASSGIGYATAIEFAKNGYNVVLTARRQDALREVAEECEEYGIRPLVITADTTDEGAVQKVADAAALEFGHFDVWVNGAAVSLFAKFEDSPLEDYRQVINTNFFGYVHGARSALKQFKRQGYGTLINISSVNAAAPQPYTSAYTASKYAIRGLSESLRMELELDGLSNTVHVCTVMPASIDTNLFQNAANYTNREVQALEPVYDPTYVAKHIFKLTKTPKREVIVGPAGKMMALEHALMPYAYEKKAAQFIDKNHLSEHLAEDTKGNLFEPIPDNTGMTGGWRETRLRADKLNAIIGTVTAGLLVILGAAYILSKKK